MTVLLAMYGLPTFAEAATAGASIVLSLLESMQDARSAFNFVIACLAPRCRDQEKSGVY
jgi:hypothetical protein